MQKTSKYFIADGDTINVDFGFVPDKIFAISALGGTELYWEWHRILTEKATSGQYGIGDAAGAKTVCASAAAGFAKYNTQVDGVKIPHPKGITASNPDGYIKVPAGAAAAAAPTISDWLATVNYASGGQDRSATVVGTCVRPPVHNGRVFELITGTGLGTSEPTTWNVQPGETVTDGGSNVFLCREEILCQIGGKGITIGADISTDSEIWYIEAELHDEIYDAGDAADNDPI